MENEKSVRDVRQAWKGLDQALGAKTSEKQRYRVKVFKSGNSLALRVPAGLGLQAGMEMDMEVEDGVLTLQATDRPKRKIDLTGIAGSVPWLKPLSRGEREFEDSPRVWDDPDWPGWKSIPE